MKSIYFFAIFILLSLNTSCFAAPDLDLIVGSVVKVKFGTHNATGFLISKDGYILTCAHVFEDYAENKDENKIEVHFYDPPQIAYSVPLVHLKKSKEKGGGFLQDTNLVEIYSEYALLKVPASQIINRDPFVFSTKVEKGDAAYFCAVGATVAPRLGKREVVATNPIFFLLSPTVMPGDSGSPVLNSKGLVVGMVLTQHPTSWGGAISSSRLVALLPPPYNNILNVQDSDRPAARTSP